jgi:hypothetical protein
VFFNCSGNAGSSAVTMATTDEAAFSISASSRPRQRNDRISLATFSDRPPFSRSSSSVAARTRAAEPKFLTSLRKVTLPTPGMLLNPIQVSVCYLSCRMMYSGNSGRLRHELYRVSDVSQGFFSGACQKAGERAAFVQENGRQQRQYRIVLKLPAASCGVSERSRIQEEVGDEGRFRNLSMIAGARAKAARSRKAVSTFPVKISLIERTYSSW